MFMTLRSPAFEPGAAIPTKYTGEGPDDLSLPLSWTHVPEGTVELALICDDADAPVPEPWVHWVLYKIPATATSLPEGLPRVPVLAAPYPMMQGKTTFVQGIGYNGPLPPPGHGTHHYNISLYALDVALPDTLGLTKNELLDAIKGHVLGRANLVGTYRRD